MLARLADAPVYLVHLTTAGSLDLVRRARARGQVVWAEACTHHLVLDDTRYLRADAARYLVVPPLRARADVDALWHAVEDGTIDAIGSDHATAPYVPRSTPATFAHCPTASAASACASRSCSPRERSAASRSTTSADC